MVGKNKSPNKIPDKSCQSGKSPDRSCVSGKKKSPHSSPKRKCITKSDKLEQCKKSSPDEKVVLTEIQKLQKTEVAPLKCDAERFILGKEIKQKEDNVKKPDKFFNEDLFDDIKIKSVKRVKSPAKTTEFKKEEKKSGSPQLKYLDVPVPPEIDLETKRNLNNLFFHVIETILITLIAMSMVSSNMYYFSHKTASMFLDTEINLPANSSNGTRNSPLKLSSSLRNAITIEDFWAVNDRFWAEYTLIDLLYWEFYDSTINPFTHTPKSDKFLYENQILGVARIRQVRVKDNSCEIHSELKRFFNSCYSFYSVFSEDTNPINSSMKNSSTKTAWVYTKADNLESFSFWGELAVYGGGGYYLDLAEYKEDSKNLIKELKENNWVSQGTRAIFIDFNLYNANVNLFCVCKIIVEFSPIGGIIPTADFHPLKLIRYLTIFNFFILACEFTYLLLILYQTGKEVQKMINQRRCYLFFFWNYIDLAILLFSYVYVVLGIVRYFKSENLIDVLDEHYAKYTEFHTLKEIQLFFNNIIAIILFLVWMRLVSYMTFTKTMLQFRKTLAKSLKDMLMFSPLFLITLLSFSMVAYIIFGNQVKTYSSVWSSFLALAQAFLGEFNYSHILETNRILGPIFYIVFIFFVFFLLLNVFIAIINDAYASVMSSDIKNPPKMGNYIRRGFVNAFTCFRVRRIKKRIPVSVRKRLFFDEIEKALLRAGFKQEEIDLFYQKYNINCDNFLDEKTRKRIMTDFDLRQIQITESSEQCQINMLKRRLNDFKDKFENLEMRLQPVIDKVDILFHRL